MTIREITQENVAASGAPEELKWCLWFNEVEKPLVLNSTNGQIIARITGSEDSSGWVGYQIELYNEPNIAFAGKLVGGIRVRPPTGPLQGRPQSQQPQRPASRLQGQVQRPQQQQQQQRQTMPPPQRRVPVDTEDDNPFNE